MNRRNLLAAAPATLALAGTAAAAPAAPNPDAGLIAHCIAFDTLERAYRATGFGHDPGTPADDAADAERDRLATAQDPIVDRICATPPRTLAGFQAVAASLALWDAELFKDGGPGGYTNQRLLAALVHGLTGRAGA